METDDFAKDINTLQLLANQFSVFSRLGYVFANAERARAIITSLDNDRLRLEQRIEKLKVEQNNLNESFDRQHKTRASNLEKVIKEISDEIEKRRLALDQIERTLETRTKYIENSLKELDRMHTERMADLADEEKTAAAKVAVITSALAKLKQRVVG